MHVGKNCLELPAVDARWIGCPVLDEPGLLLQDAMLEPRFCRSILLSCGRNPGWLQRCCTSQPMAGPFPKTSQWIGLCQMHRHHSEAAAPRSTTRLPAAQMMKKHMSHCLRPRGKSVSSTPRLTHLKAALHFPGLAGNANEGTTGQPWRLRGGAGVPCRPGRSRRRQTSTPCPKLPCSSPAERDYRLKTLPFVLCGQDLARPGPSLFEGCAHHRRYFAPARSAGLRPACYVVVTVDVPQELSLSRSP